MKTKGDYDVVLRSTKKRPALLIGVGPPRVVSADRAEVEVFTTSGGLTETLIAYSLSKGNDGRWRITREEIFDLTPVRLCFSMAAHEGALLIGARPTEVLAFFSEAAPVPPGVGCWRYQFASGESLTLLFEQGVVTHSWLAPSAELPKACAGQLQHTLQLERDIHSLGYLAPCPDSLRLFRM